MNTNHFDYMIALSETGNLSKAAKRLGISQPVLSRYLANLEEQLNAQLFVQENRRFHITEAGKIYVNGMRRMKELQIQMHRSFDNMSDKKKIDLSIGMSPFYGGKQLALFYPDLLGHYPTLNLQIEEGSTTQLFQKLLSKEVSVLLNLYDPSLMPGTKAATISKKELFMVLPDFHPLAAEAAACGGASQIPQLTPEQFASLTDIPFVYLNTQTLVGMKIEQLFHLYNFTPVTLLCTSNNLAVSSLLQTGNYAGFLMEGSGHQAEHLIYFHLPHPIFLEDGLIFLEEHQPSEVECFLYQLEYQIAANSNPQALFINELGRRLLNKECCYGY